MNAPSKFQDEIGDEYELTKKISSEYALYELQDAPGNVYALVKLETMEIETTFYNARRSNRSEMFNMSADEAVKKALAWIE